MKSIQVAEQGKSWGLRHGRQRVGQAATLATPEMFGRKRFQT